MTAFGAAFEKALRQPITDWLDARGISHRFDSGGKHPRVILNYGGDSRFVVMSGTPGDRRASENALRDIRKELRRLGWTPESDRNQESNSQMHAPKNLKRSKSDAQAPSTGAASDAVRKSPADANSDVLTLVGVVVPTVPAELVGQKTPFGGGIKNEPWPSFLEKRRAFMLAAADRGASNTQISDALGRAGHVVSSQAINQSLVHARKQANKQPRGPMQQNAGKLKLESATPTPPKATEPNQLALKIAEAIEPIIAEEMAALQLKADAFEAVRGLMNDV